jgi:hypothetical protein
MVNSLPQSRLAMGRSMDQILDVAGLILFCMSTGIIIWIVEMRSSRLEEKIDRLSTLLNTGRSRQLRSLIRSPHRRGREARAEPRCRGSWRS